MIPSISDVLTLNQVTDLIGVDSFDDWLDRYDSYANFPFDHDLSEEENYEREASQRDEDATNYIDAVVSVAEKLLGEHKLTLREEKTRKMGTVYRVLPVAKRGWLDALGELRETINGVGYFEFSSTKELLSSGPYISPKQGVLQHLHWIKRFPDVYGCGSVSHMLERALRY